MKSFDKKKAFHHFYVMSSILMFSTSFCYKFSQTIYDLFYFLLVLYENFMMYFLLLLYDKGFNPILICLNINQMI